MDRGDVDCGGLAAALTVSKATPTHPSARPPSRHAISVFNAFRLKSGSKTPALQNFFCFTIPFIVYCSNTVLQKQVNTPPSTPISSNPIHLQDWPHAPIHRLQQAGAYMVTSGTYQKAPIFNSPERLTLLANSLFDLAKNGKTTKPKEPDQASPFLNCNRRQSTGQHARPKSLVPILGIPPNLPTFLFRPPKLRPPQRRPPRRGKQGVSLPMVLSKLVRA
jgi:hypothetical protein